MQKNALIKLFDKDVNDDDDKVAVSPIFSAPEIFVDKDPFAFDIFSIGILYSIFVFDFQRDEKKMSSFRSQLEEADFDIDGWVQRELGGSILDEKVLTGLDFLDKNLLRLLKKMLLRDPSSRISAADALSYLDSLDPPLASNFFNDGNDILGIFQTS